LPWHRSDPLFREEDVGGFHVAVQHLVVGPPHGARTALTQHGQESVPAGDMTFAAVVR
jgi:hypothetical protein